MAAAPDEGLKPEWRSLSRSDRATLASDAARGLRGRNNKDAALMLWWATKELRRGPRTALWTAAAIVATIIGLQLVTGRDLAEVARSLVSSISPIILLIPLATWVFRRPKLQRSVQLNAAVLSGKTFDGPPDPEEAERILARVKREGWLRGTRPERDT